MANPFGRNQIIPLTNKSGGSVANGDFVYLGDGATADSFTTGTTLNRTGPVGIAQQTIANNATGLVLVQGYAALVNVNASVTINHFGASYSVAKQATDVGTSRVAGTCLFFLTGGTTPDAVLWQPDLGAAGLTNPMTTTGDIIYSSDNSGTPARLAAVAAGKGLISAGTSTAPAWGYHASHGANCYGGSDVALSTSGENWVAMNTEDFDTDAYHFTSAAALTGTVQKTASSAAIVGTGTSFTTELSVNQVITIPGTATEVGIVSVITDNTHLTLTANMANNASGQTATRQSAFFVIPAGLGGKYQLSFNARLSANTRPYLAARKNANQTGAGQIVLFSASMWDTGGFGTAAASSAVVLAAGDSIGLSGVSQTGGACNVVSGAGGSLPWFSLAFLGT